MDLQKEREAFEAAMKSVSGVGKHYFEIGPNGQYKSDIVHFGWTMWQAKAQAVPGGYVLVEKTDLECAIDALKWASNEDSDLCAKQAGVLEDVLKAQEPAND